MEYLQKPIVKIVIVVIDPIDEGSEDRPNIKDPRDLESWVDDIEDPVKFKEAIFRTMSDPVVFQKLAFQVYKPGAKTLTGMVDYEPYPYQERIARDESLKIVINKSRQTGMSTSTVLDHIHRAVLRKNYMAIFISLRQDQANELIRKGRAMIHAMAPGWRLPLVTDTKSTLEFNNRSTVKSVSAAASAALGFSGDLVFDEFAHIPNDREIYDRAMHITVRGGLRVRILSTPYGDRGIFAEIAKGAKTGENDWSLHEVHFSECPDLDEKVARSLCASDEIFRQEYGLEFLDEASSMFSWEMLMNMTDVELPQYNLASKIPRNSNSWFVGIDPGEKVNEAGFVVQERIGSHYLTRHILAQKMSKDTIVDLAKAWFDKVDIEKIYIDGTGGGVGVVADLQRDIGHDYIEDIQFTAPKKAKLVYNGIGLAEANQLSIPGDSKRTTNTAGQYIKLSMPEYLKHQLHGLERVYDDLMATTKFSGKSKGLKCDDLSWAYLLSLADNIFETHNVGVQVVRHKDPRRRRKY
jgi:phage FluMu gp28-like protein